VRDGEQLVPNEGKTLHLWAGHLRYAQVSFSHPILYIYTFKKIRCSGCQWLTPVILAPCEAEIRRIVVGVQPKQIVHEIPSLK
jgi:hypothetical protein